MQQDSLWATAPQPRNMTMRIDFDEVEREYWVVITLTWSKSIEGQAVHHITVGLSEFERDLAGAAWWAADRYFWRNRYPRLVEREVKAWVRKCREDEETREAVRSERVATFN